MVIGQNDRCRIDKLGKAILNDAYVTHNHPKDKTEYTFTTDDITMFVDYHLNTLLGIDYKYAYEMNCNFEQFMFDDDCIDWQNEYNVHHALVSVDCERHLINYWRAPYV